MKLIKPSVELLEQEPGIDGILKQIELAGRISYKSYDKITDDSYKKFSDMLIKKGHLSPLEHGAVYLRIHWREDIHIVFKDMFTFYSFNPYSIIIREVINKEDLCPDLFISTNYRVLVENDRLDDLKYLCEPTKYHERRITFKVVCSIGTSRELNRHRTLSIVEQSTRFCNFSKDKFDNEVTFCTPEWFTGVSSVDDCTGDIFLDALDSAENNYLGLIKEGWKPQQAREVLPLATATEVVYTAFVSDWEHFLSLRSPKYGATGVHPNAAVIGDMIYDMLTKNRYIDG